MTELEEGNIFKTIYSRLKEKTSQTFRRPVYSQPPAPPAYVDPYEMPVLPLFQEGDMNYEVKLAPENIREINTPNSLYWQGLSVPLSELPPGTIVSATLGDNRNVDCVRNKEGSWINGWEPNPEHSIIRSWGMGTFLSKQEERAREEKIKIVETERIKFLIEQGWPIIAFHGTSSENFALILQSRIYRVVTSIFLSDHLAVAAGYTDKAHFLVLAIPADHLTNFNKTTSFAGRKLGIRSDLAYVKQRENNSLEIDLKTKLNYKFSPELAKYLDSINLSYKLAGEGNERTIVIPLLCYYHPDWEKETGHKVEIPRAWDEDLTQFETRILLRDGSERKIKTRPVKIPTQDQI